MRDRPPDGRETSGTTIALTVRYVRSVGGSAALRRVLEGAGEARAISELEDESVWSTYEQKIALLAAAAQVLNDPQVARHIGQTVMRHRVGAGLKMLLSALGSPGMVLRNVARVAPRFSTVCRMRAEKVTSRSAVITYELNRGCEPHRTDCDLNVGLLSQAPVIFGLPPALIEHDECQVDGADRCVYRVRWKRRSRLPWKSRRIRLHRLEEQQLSLSERMESLQSATAELLSADDIDVVIERLGSKAASAVGANGFLVLIRPEDRDEPKLTFGGLSEVEAAELAERLMWPHPDRPLPPCVVADIGSAQRSFGKLAAVYPSNGEFIGAESELLRAYARHAAAALEVSSALDEARRQQATSQALLDLARSLADATTVRNVARTLAEATPGVVHADAASVYLWDASETMLRPEALFGYPEEIRETMSEIAIAPSDTPELAGVMEGGKPAFYSSDPSEDDFVHRMLEMAGAAWAVAVPIYVRARPVGLIASIGSRKLSKRSRENLSERMAGLADHATKAFENAMLLGVERARVEKLREESHILSMVAGGHDLGETLDAVARLVEEQVSRGACSIMLLDEEGDLRTRSAPSMDDEQARTLDGLPPGARSASVGASVESGQPVYVPDISSDVRWDGWRSIAGILGWAASWSTPIVSASSGRVLGVINAFLSNTGEPDADAVGYMDLGAQLAGIAIDRKGLEEKLTHRAFHDPLTELPNRTLFTDRVEHALLVGKRSGIPLAVLFVDLDNFKEVNDRHGHPAGDTFLRSMAERLTSCLRAGDTGARFGGDEFGVLLENADRAEAVLVAERILGRLAEDLVIEGTEVRVGASMGIALSGPGLGAEELLRNADTAMYSAKAGGRDRYEIFEEKMRSGMLRRLEMQSALRAALENDEIAVHYQPIFRLDTMQPVGVEALARWEHPDKGFISPGDFIPVAEETGLIVPLGLEVLGKACEQIAEWDLSAPERTPLDIAVNVSARQLQSPELVGKVIEVLEQSSVVPERMVVEITESAIMADPDEIARRLERLVDAGVRVAIDDFGTGYSSLSYLRRLPVGILKIDRFFVDGIRRGPEESGFVKSIIKLGHSLGLDVVAEGIEDEEELSILRAAGCQFGQGFLMARPVPPDQIPEVLERSAALRVS